MAEATFAILWSLILFYCSMCVLGSVPYISYYYIPVTYPDIWDYNTPSIVLFVQECFGCLGFYGITHGV